MPYAFGHGHLPIARDIKSSYIAFVSVKDRTRNAHELAPLGAT
jgi:hypothetical protein